MTETKDFPTTAIASLTTGISLCERFAAIHEAAEWLMGHPIWTHHFANKQLWHDMQRAVLEQHPKMPTKMDGITKDNYLEYAEKVKAEFGPTVKIKKGHGSTAMSPADGIPEHLKDRTIFMHTDDDGSRG